ncbi:MAG: GNAT family N-acetyltransferase [Bacteroidaceae bacterium]|nr:GNAT family N-acetyltransferase [Bacteroidaceae bacterium]
MIILEKITTGHNHYPFVEELLHSAFPENERRDDAAQRWNTDNEPLFHCLLVLDEATLFPVGLLTYWEFDSFLYIEHFAIHQSFRGKGLGGEVLQAFFRTYGLKPIILEVEHPSDGQSMRRVRFYQRQGLTLWECDYLQPPYRSTDSCCPLYLMAFGKLSFEKDYNTIRQTIYRYVYSTRFSSHPSHPWA